MSAPVPDNTPDTAPLLLACLCAAWCRTCDAYRDTLAEVRTRLGVEAAGLHLVWVDIEDEADLVGDLDIENFPTLLLARGTEPLFFGTVLPHAGTVERLLRGALDGSLAPAPGLAPEARALVAPLRAHPPF